jgi:hypothetical protein
MLFRLLEMGIMVGMGVKIPVAVLSKGEGVSGLGGCDLLNTEG